MSSNNIREYDPTLFENHIVNVWSVGESERRILELSKNIEENQKIAWLLRAVTYIDLTTLGGDDTGSNVTRLCLKALSPILPKILGEINFLPEEIRTAAVCVYPSRVPDAYNALFLGGEKPALPVAAVATGFPSGQYSLNTRIAEIKDAVSSGAAEIDVVIDRSLVISGKWKELYNELVAMKGACGSAALKTILAVGELPTLSHVYKASMVAMMAGSDFIKTSTGKETTNATIPVGIVMSRAIREYYRLTNKKVGLKAAGGLRTADDAITWLVLLHEELGYVWFTKDLFRIGASSLLGAIETKLYQMVLGEDPDPREFQMG